MCEIGGVRGFRSSVKALPPVQLVQGPDAKVFGPVIAQTPHCQGVLVVPAPQPDWFVPSRTTYWPVTNGLEPEAQVIVQVPAAQVPEVMAFGG